MKCRECDTSLGECVCPISSSVFEDDLTAARKRRQYEAGVAVETIDGRHSDLSPQWVKDLVQESAERLSRIDDLERRLASLKSPWRPAHEPPPDDQIVLVYLPRALALSNVHSAKWRDGRLWIVGHLMAHDLPCGADSVTHWMPLPDPPSD